MGIFIALMIAVIWGFSEIYYTKATFTYSRKLLLINKLIFEGVFYLIIVFFIDRNVIGEFDLNKFLYIIPVTIISVLGGIFYIKSVSNGKLSIVSPIMASYPIFLILIGYYIFKEKINNIQLLLTFIIAINIIFLSIIKDNNKKTSKKNIIGIFFGLIYMILMVLLTYIEKNAYLNYMSLAQWLYYYSIQCLPFALIYYFSIRKNKIRHRKYNKDVILGVSLSVIGTTLNSYITSIDNISIISSITALYTLVTQILSKIKLHEKLSIKQRICTLIITISTIMLLII